MVRPATSPSLILDAQAGGCDGYHRTNWTSKGLIRPAPLMVADEFLPLLQETVRREEFGRNHTQPEEKSLAMSDTRPDQLFPRAVGVGVVKRLWPCSAEDPSAKFEAEFQHG